MSDVYADDRDWALGVLDGRTDQYGRSTTTAHWVVAVDREIWNEDFLRKSWESFDDADDINVVPREETLHSVGARGHGRYSSES